MSSLDDIVNQISRVQMFSPYVDGVLPVHKDQKKNGKKMSNRYVEKIAEFTDDEVLYAMRKSPNRALRSYADEIDEFKKDPTRYHLSRATVNENGGFDVADDPTDEIRSLRNAFPRNTNAALERIRSYENRDRYAPLKTGIIGAGTGAAVGGIAGGLRSMLPGGKGKALAAAGALTGMAVGGVGGLVIGSGRAINNRWNNRDVPNAYLDALSAQRLGIGRNKANEA